MPPDRTASLVAALLRHEPCDERESSSLSEVLDGLRTLAHPFDESADFVHITGSAVVISPAGVLLHRHKRLGIWLQPGGHVDAGETPAETAVRETREETGINGRHHDVSRVFHVDAHNGGRGHRHLDVRYLLLADPVTPRPDPGESPSVRWVPLSGARRMADPGLAGALRHPVLVRLLELLHHAEV